MSRAAHSIDPNHPFAGSLKAAPPLAHVLADDGGIPNHPRFPLLIYPDAICLPGGRRAAASLIQELFHENGWTGSWVNGVFSHHHYHATAHEVLGCLCGSATILFGGEKGVEIEFRAGDVAVIPAGVGHKNLGCSSDFGVVGAYPPGQSPDMNYGDPGERPKSLADIAGVALPGSDPVFGVDGPLMTLWS